MNDLDKDKNIDQEKDIIPSMPAFFEKIAAIYYGVEEKDDTEAVLEPENKDNDTLEAPAALENPSESTKRLAINEDEAVVEPDLEQADFVQDDSNPSEIHDAVSDPVFKEELDALEDLHGDADGEADTQIDLLEAASSDSKEIDFGHSDEVDKMSRRQHKKQKEDADLLLTNEEARARMDKNPIKADRDTKQIALEAIRRKQQRQNLLLARQSQKTSKQKWIVLSLALAAVLVLVIAASFILKNRPEKLEDEVLDFKETLVDLDYITANRIYIDTASEDTAVLDQMLADLKTREASIVDRFILGHIEYDQAHDELTSLAMFMVLWPEDQRTVHNAITIASADHAIDPQEILSAGFLSIDAHQAQIQNFRMGQQLANMNAHASAIPYLRAAVDTDGSVSATAADLLRRSESAYHLHITNAASQYIANGDELRARLLLESADTILPNDEEFTRLLASLPPMDYSELRLDISAMAMTYFDAERYHDSLLIVQVGKTFLADLLEAIESGASLSSFEESAYGSTDFRHVTQGDEGLRLELSEHLKRDIESLEQLENELRHNIITELRAKATAFADQGKYRDARDVIEMAIEFNPDDEELSLLMADYHQKTKLKLNQFMTQSNSKGFGLEALAEVEDRRGHVHKDVTKLISSLYMPALHLDDLPHKHNRFQGVFYLMDLADATNVQIVILQAGQEIYRSNPMNVDNDEQNFDVAYDFTKDLEIQILGSTSRQATKYNMMSGIHMLLDAYFYNDGTWDEVKATELHSRYHIELDEAKRALDTKLSTSLKVNLYDELHNDSIWTSIFGHEALQAKATDSNGIEHEKVLLMKGRQSVKIGTRANHFRGQLFFEETSVKGEGLYLMVEDAAGKRYVSDKLSSDASPITLDMPIEGDVTFMLLNHQGERLQQDRYRVLVKGQFYDTTQNADPDGTDQMSDILDNDTEIDPSDEMDNRDSGGARN